MPASSPQNNGKSNPRGEGKIPNMKLAQVADESHHRNRKNNDMQVQKQRQEMQDTEDVEIPSQGYDYNAVPPGVRTTTIGIQQWLKTHYRKQAKPKSGFFTKEDVLVLKNAKNQISYGKNLRRLRLEEFMGSSFVQDSSKKGGYLWDAPPDITLLSNAIYMDDGLSVEQVQHGRREDIFTQERMDFLLEKSRNFDKERLESGLNPATLMAEYRRKVVMNALFDVKDGIDESREDCKSKMEKYVELRDSVLLPALPPQKTAANSPSQKRHLTDTHSVSIGTKTTSPLKTSRSVQRSIDLSENEKNREFKADWANYNIMKLRWTYLLPQTRELTSKRDLFIPQSQSDKTFKVEGDVVVGPLKDLQNHKKHKNKNLTNTTVSQTSPLLHVDASNSR